MSSIVLMAHHFPYVGMKTWPKLGTIGVMTFKTKNNLSNVSKV
jgi:hypothetical protein